MISNKIQNFHRKIVCSPVASLHVVLLRSLLYLISLPFQLISQIRAFFYQYQLFKIKKVSKPIISVGNISVGGTGKTPLCIELIQLCLNQQKIPALVSRGYGADENKIYQNRFPKVPMKFSPNRLKACNELMQSHPEISLFILDDAFQHQKIHRDLNILLINAKEPFGYDFCLPRGFLRESLSAMNRANLIILTHADEVKTVEKEKILFKMRNSIKKKIPIMEALHAPECLLSPLGEKISFSEFTKLKYNKLGLLCGIAHPEAFVSTLNKCGLNASKSFYYPDHYQYSTNDFKIIGKEKDLFECLITTEKDIVKIPLDVKKELNIYTLVIKMEIIEVEKLLDLIKEITK